MGCSPAVQQKADVPKSFRVIAIGVHTCHSCTWLAHHTSSLCKPDTMLLSRGSASSCAQSQAAGTATSQCAWLAMSRTRVRQVVARAVPQQQAPAAPALAESVPVSLVSVEPPVPIVTPAKRGINWALPAGIIGAVLAAAAFRKLKGHGSVGGLVDRGYLNENRSRVDPFYADVMRNVNTVQIEELSEDAISAARARRSRERANQRLDLEDVDLPDNHPWAVKKPVSKEQDELIKARLSVRRGTALGSNAEEGQSAGGERGMEAGRSGRRGRADAQDRR